MEELHHLWEGLLCDTKHHHLWEGLLCDTKHHLLEGLLCDTNQDDATNCSCRFTGKDASEPYIMLDYSENNVNEEEVQQQQSLVKVEGHPGEEEGMIKKSHLHEPLTESITAPLSAVTEKNRMRSRERGPKFVFRTRSKKEVMEDGYKWRKYGKKPVKGSPFPRNYYRCLEGSCTVRKRIERDPMDGNIVITTYEGTHNHERPCVVYYCLTELKLR